MGIFLIPMFFVSLRFFPSPPPGKLRAKSCEFLALLQKWDSMGSLFFLPTSDCHWRLRCGAFGAPKDPDAEKIIINPTAASSTMRRISRWSSSLSPGSFLCSLVLRFCFGFLLDVDDLLFFVYRSFAVPPTRARRIAVNVEVLSVVFCRF